MATGKDERIKELLGAGLSAETVAMTIGVDPSYVSQLMSGEDFYNEVTNMRSKNLIAHTQRDLTWDSLEDKLLVHLDEMIDEHRFSKPEQILAAIRTVNSAVRRGIPVQQNNKPIATVVNLQIPVAIKSLFTLNSKSEVIDVNGQTLVTMPSDRLVKQIAEDKGEAGEGNFTKLGRHIQRFNPDEDESTESLAIAR